MRLSRRPKGMPLFGLTIAVCPPKHSKGNHPSTDPGFTIQRVATHETDKENDEAVDIPYSWL